MLFLEPEQLLPSGDGTLPISANAQKSESENCSLTTQGTEVSSPTRYRERQAGLGADNRRSQLPGGDLKVDRPGSDPGLDHGPL